MKRKTFLFSILLAFYASILLSFGGYADSTLFRTSFEFNDVPTQYYDSVYASSGNITAIDGAERPECKPHAGIAFTGNNALLYSGKGSGSSYCTFISFDVNIPVTQSTNLSYWIQPLQNNGRFVAIDLITSDGSTLRDCGATDQNGVSMHPNSGHGSDSIPLNEWSQIKSNIGGWLNGKTIKKILVNYDKPSMAAEYKGFIDDILITNDAVPTTLFKNGIEQLEIQPSIDSVFASNNMASNPGCSVFNSLSHSGANALYYSGQSNDGNSAYCTFHAFDVEIPVTEATKLSYWIYPEQNNGRFVAVDFITKSGNTLRDCGATDLNGVSMHPNAAHGADSIPLNTWTQVAGKIGEWLAGDTVIKLLINYDQPSNSGFFSGLIDDILFIDGTLTPVDSTMFYTSLESNNLQPDYLDSVYYSHNVQAYSWASVPECSPRQESPRSGKSTLMYSGQSTGDANTTSYCVFRSFDVEIPVSSTTQMSYWINPNQDNGRYVAIDYVTKKGNTLRDCGAVDQNGIGMHPQFGHGGNIPINEWTQILCNVGQWLNGDTIQYILVNYDSKVKGDFRGFIDDIQITTSTKPDIKVENIELSVNGNPEITVLGGSLTVIAVVTPEFTTVQGVNWRLSNNTLASIDQTGKVTALKNGVVTVFASSKDGSGAEGSIDITISNQTVQATSITLTPNSSATIDIPDGAITVTGLVGPSNATNKNIIWQIDNENVASVEPDGNTCSVTAISNGSAILTAFSESNQEVFAQLVLFVSNQATGIESMEINKHIIYPNPVTDKICVANTNSLILIQIISAEGKILKSVLPNGGPVEIDVKDFKQGLYVVRLVNADNISSSITIVKR